LPELFPCVPYRNNPEHRLVEQMNIHLGQAGTILVTIAVVSISSSWATVSGANKQAIAIDPKVAALVKQASSEAKVHQYDAAVRRLSAALQMKPETKAAAAIYSWRADAFIHKGDFNKAMSDASESIRLNPRDYRGYLERGLVYRRTGSLDKAIRDYYTTIHLNPNFARAYYDRAIVYSLKSDYNQAIRDNTEAIRHAPKEFNNYLGRASAFEDMGQLDKASADYDQVTQLNPRNTADYRFRGSANFAKGNYKAAALDFEKAVQLSPGDYDALHSLAWFQATCQEDSLRNGKEALEKSKRACELSRWQSADVVDTLAAAYAELGDFDDAVKYETQAINMKGVYAFKRKRMQERLDLYRQHKPYRKECKLKTR
jgi:tetratricopeptide (TPR) repeat protein